MWQGCHSYVLSSQIQATITKPQEMDGHGEKVLEATIVQGIEQLHATMDFVMVNVFANTKVGCLIQDQ
jgi:hypothetical protein